METMFYNERLEKLTLLILLKNRLRGSFNDLPSKKIPNTKGYINIANKDETKHRDWKLKSELEKKMEIEIRTGKKCKLLTLRITRHWSQVGNTVNICYVGVSKGSVQEVET